jgi:CRP/FNR family transcriptional regulator
MFAANLYEIQTHDEPVAQQSATGSSPAAENWASMSLVDLAAALGTTLQPNPRLSEITFPVRRLKPGETLCRAGDEFDAIYVIRCGFFKTVCVDESGNEVVLAFPMGGDVIGLDGLDRGRYNADVVALDTSHVAVVSFARIARLGHKDPSIGRLLYGAFSRELTREQGMIWLLGTLNAEARVATFLLDLSDRLGRLGYSRTSFALRMTRQEIGSYLGLKLETVSRTLSAFAAGGLLAVNRKVVTLRDPAGLRRIVDRTTHDEAEDQPSERTLAAGRLALASPCARRLAPVAA